MMRQMVEKEHFNTLDIPFRYKDDAKKCKAYLAATAEWLKKLGYLDMSYVYMEDEPNDIKEYEIVRKQGAMIKSANPQIGRMCTEQTITSNKAWGDLYGAVSIWCPLWGLWNDSTAQERLAQGEKLWSYTALCQGPEGTPWWQIDMDPLNFRSPMWISWHFNITGFPLLVKQLLERIRIVAGSMGSSGLPQKFLGRRNAALSWSAGRHKRICALYQAETLPRISRRL